MSADLDAIREKWLRQCGACDAGIGLCTHPEADYRPVLLDLVNELENTRADLRTALAIIGAIRHEVSGTRWRTVGDR